MDRPTFSGIALVLLTMIKIGVCEYPYYVGCFRDATNRALPISIEDPKMTVNLCIGFCILQGQPYAGLQMGDECHCGVHYNKHGWRSPNKCSYSCAGDRFTKCGGQWSLGVYKTADANLKDSMEHDKIRDLTYSHMVRPRDGFKAGVVAFIELPTNSEYILAATSQQLVKLRHGRSCRMVAGLTLENCQVKDNPYSFTSIRHIIHVDFSTLRDPSKKLSSSKAILVADEAEHCVTVVNVQNLDSSDYDVIGRCGSASRMARSTPYYSLYGIRLSIPTYLTVVVSPKTIRVVITCRIDDKIYPVILHVLSDTYFANDYYLSEARGYLADIVDAFYYPMIQLVGVSGSEGNKFCHFDITGNELPLGANLSCGIHNESFNLKLINGWPMIITRRRLNYLEYHPQGSITLRNVVVNNLPSSVSQYFDSFSTVPSSDSVILYSRTSRTFYYVKLSLWFGFNQHADQKCSQEYFHMWYESTTELCAYSCLKHNGSSFTFDSQSKVCYLHSQENYVAQPESCCYVIKPQN